MLRICLIGPGNVDFHYQKILGIDKKRFDRELEKIVKVFNPFNIELALLPDDGISIEIAKKFKEKGGKVIGLVPLRDKYFGINHLKSYIETKVNGKKLFDKIIDTGDWPKHDLTIGLFGDIILYLGRSPGTEGERNYAVYMYKIIYGFKKGVNQPIENVHKEARAGKTVYYTIFVYSPFLKSGKLSEEDEVYAKKFKINLVYISNANDLGIKLKELNN